MHEHLAQLQAEVDELRAAKLKLGEEREQYRRLYMEALERCKTLERGIIAGRKAESFSGEDGQLALQLLEQLFGAEPGEPDKPEQESASRDESPKKRRKPTGRKPLPEHLPRVEIEVLPPEVEREGLNAFERIGEETRETLERRPASAVVVRVIRPKFVRNGKMVEYAEDPAETCALERAPERDAAPEFVTLETPAKRGAAVVTYIPEQLRSQQLVDQGARADSSAEPVVLIADVPELPIDRGLAGPGFLSDTVVRRWGDHCPANRLERIYARDGVELARSTICSWHMQLAQLAKCVVDAMYKDARTQPYLCTDATGVLVQAKERCRRGHFWVLVAPEKHVLFRYSRKHDGAAVDQLIAGYKGYLVADAHSVYDHIYGEKTITEVACWAHSRRYFFKALATDPDRAKHALSLMKGLFRIEREIADDPRKKREKVRKAKSKPIVEAFFRWCDEQRARVLDETPISKALNYAHNQRTALARFLDDGRLPMTNNISERHLRREAVGRKNWLFVGSDDGAETNTIFVSLLASCQLHGIEPWAYLRDLFCLLPSWPQTRVLELAPAYWRETLKQEDTQQRLAANIYRSVTLEHSPPE